MRIVVALSLGFLLAGCEQEAPVAPPVTATQASDQPADPPYVGKVWVSTTPGHSLGTMLIFLPDRTLVMDSCFETYRLAKWGIAGSNIRWLEDTIPVEATIEMPRPNQLLVRVAGQDRTQSYTSANVPYSCPDMPR